MDELIADLKKIGLDQVDRSNWPKTFEDLAGVIHAELARQRLVEEDDELPAIIVALRICDTYQRGSWYVPRCETVATSVRNARIWQEFTGRNTAQLARRFGLTQRHIQNAVASERERRRHQQADLFDETGS